MYQWVEIYQQAVKRPFGEGQGPLGIYRSSLLGIVSSAQEHPHPVGPLDEGRSKQSTSIDLTPRGCVIFQFVFRSILGSRRCH